MHASVMVRWMLTFMFRFYKMNFKLALNITTNLQGTLSFNKIMTLSILAKRHRSGSQDNGIKLLPWPAQSADVAPIVHLWNHLRRKLKEYKHSPSEVLELWERVKKEWNKIESEVCQRLIESMPRRVAAVIKAKGGYTKY